jgi:hypothetical protein
MFSETMVGFHGAEPAAIAAAYDFSEFDFRLTRVVPIDRP